MKKVTIFFIAILISFVSFAQKAKGNTNQHGTEINNYFCPMHPDVLSNKPGKCTICGSNLNLSSKEKMKMDVMKIYTCPMHSNEVSDKNGKCPICGMSMIEKKKVIKSKS